MSAVALLLVDDDYEPLTRPDIYIPAAVLAGIPRGWTTATGSIFVRYGLRALGLA